MQVQESQSGRQVAPAKHKALKTASPRWELVSGLGEVAASQAQLITLAERCGQAGTMDFFDYYLNASQLETQGTNQLLRRRRTFFDHLPSFRSKLPHLLVRKGRNGLEAAVLMLEYCLGGKPIGVLVPVDPDGFRSVIAPADERAAVVREAADFMLKRGAALVLISYMEDGGALLAGTPEQRQMVAALFNEAPRMIGTEVREASRRLRLRATFDETLEPMGADTRRSLRRSSRRVLTELGATFVPHAQLSMAEFQEINQKCLYSVSQQAAHWRYTSAHNPRGGVFAGLRAADGRWLSLIGAHRESETLHLDWQMNVTGLGTLSLVSAMRALLVSYEIQQGTRWIRFEAGTPHAMSRAFVKEYARDSVFASRLVPLKLLRRAAAWLETGSPLISVLNSESLTWRDSSRANGG